MDSELLKLEPLERIEKLQELLKQTESIRDKAETDIVEIKKALERAAFEVEEIRKQELEEHHIKEEEEERERQLQQTPTIETAVQSEQKAESLDEQVRQDMPGPSNQGQNLYIPANQQTVDRLAYIRNQAAGGERWSDADYNFFKEAKDRLQGMYVKDASQEQKQALTQGKSLLDQIDNYKKGL